MGERQNPHAGLLTPPLQRQEDFQYRILPRQGPEGSGSSAVANARELSTGAWPMGDLPDGSYRLAEPVKTSGDRRTG